MTADSSSISVVLYVAVSGGAAVVRGYWAINKVNQPSINNITVPPAIHQTQDTLLDKFIYSKMKHQIHSHSKTYS